VGKRSILFWLIAAYVTFIALWLVLRVLFFDRFWPLALLNTVAEYLFLPLPVFLLLGLVRRNWVALLPLAIPTAAFVVLFGGLFLPRIARPVEGNDEPLITAMSFNVLYGNADYAAIARSVRAVSPDLVGMQELSAASAEAIATALEDEYPYSALKPLEPWRGAGLLSRFPIETVEPFSLPPLNIALHATINREGRRIHVFVVHLSANNFLDRPVAEYPALAVERYGRRATEAVRLQEEIAGLDEPFILMCDCNLTDTSEAYSRLRGFMRDSFREAGWGFRHTLNIPTVPFPVQRLDYVWHSDKFVAVDAFVGPAGGSDHLPAVAKLRLVKAL
jgi:vancomycin resistance protein VanJ